MEAETQSLTLEIGEMMQKSNPRKEEGWGRLISISPEIQDIVLTRLFFLYNSPFSKIIFSNKIL